MSLVRTETPRPGVLLLTLDRPDKRNALNWALIDELCGILRGLHDRDDVQAVVLAGAGELFCAGADIAEQFAEDRTETGRPDIGHADLWSLLETLPQPAIAAVHGAAVTGGFLLAYSCDAIIAETGAFFQDTHAKLGLIPTGGEVQRLAARIGPTRAAELLLTSARLDAETARDWGLVNRVAEEGAAVPAALDHAEAIAGNVPASVRAIKRMLNTGLRSGMAPGLLADEFENRAGAANLHRSAESRRRIAAFLGR